jgi:hypothetical protein
MKNIFISYFIAMTFLCQHVITAQDYQSCIAEATEKCSLLKPISKPIQPIILNNNTPFFYDFSRPSIVYVRENKLYSDKEAKKLIVNLSSNNSAYPNDGSYTLFTFACNGSLPPMYCKPPTVPSIGSWPNPDFVNMMPGGPGKSFSVYLKPVDAPTTAVSGSRTFPQNQSYKVTGIRHTKSK